MVYSRETLKKLSIGELRSEKRELLLLEAYLKMEFEDKVKKLKYIDHLIAKKKLIEKEDKLKKR